MFTTDKIGDSMTIAMRADDAAGWFGVPPPDLSVIARARGTDWLYTYLTTFYADPNPARPFGVNNLMFPDVGMPHVLVGLQGIQRKVCKEIPLLAANGGEMRDPLTSEYVTEEKCGNES